MALLRSPKHQELKPEELKWKCDLDCFEFETTDNLKPIEEIVGQERALKALKLGVDMTSQGYNIFITGLSGTGKVSTVKNMLKKIRPQKSKIFDYAYVNNFNDTDRPLLLSFPAGKATVFRNTLNQAIKFLQENIPSILENDPFVSKKKKLLSEFSNNQQKLMNTFEKKLKRDNLTVGQVNVGEVSRPEILAVIGDQPVMVQQLDEFIREKKITRKQAESITKKYANYQEELQSVFRKSLTMSQEFQEKIVELECESVKELVQLTIKDIKSKFRIKNVQRYLDSVTDNILQNLEIFKGQKPTREETEEGVIVDYLKSYDVNIILNNTNVKERPVIIEISPTYSNLFGIIEKYSDGSGGWYADFTRIKAGSLLRANGGYLVINAVDAFSEPGVWRTLKRVLLYGKLEIQDSSSVYQFSPSVLKPEPIEINTKIIMIGNNHIYSLLSGYEDDFNKIFKIKAEFDYEMARSEKTLNEYARIIKKLVHEEKLLPMNRESIGKIVEYGARYAGQKDKLTTRFAYIADLVRESSFWAQDSGEKVVTDYHVVQAYEAAKERHGLYESKMKEMISENTIMIDTEGSRVGIINGLAVYTAGMYSFGKPARISASVALGNGNIINVEREAGLSGSTHNKGMLVISGYFKGKFGKRIPLSLNASIVFEQGYGMIDGDSASAAEVCCLISAISQIPIKQNFAITGSVNQNGDIQPIGGVNEKIEGFFEICKIRGLNKKHGVIIPIQNVKDLMLSDEIISAVDNKDFHIYAVSKIEEAIEIITGYRSGKLMKNERYHANTIFGEVEKVLREMRNRVRPRPAPAKTPSKPPAKKKTKK